MLRDKRKAVWHAQIISWEIKMSNDLCWTSGIGCVLLTDISIAGCVANCAGETAGYMTIGALTGSQLCLLATLAVSLTSRGSKAANETSVDEQTGEQPHNDTDSTLLARENTQANEQVGLQPNIHSLYGSVNGESGLVVGNGAPPTQVRFMA